MQALVNRESKTSNREEKYFGFVKRFLVNENGLGMWENTVMETLP